MFCSGDYRDLLEILPNFLWPGLRQNVIRFCRSCDVCERTVKRGSVKKVPLGSMPLINTPFKRVAVDIVGPIAPQSEAGHHSTLPALGRRPGVSPATATVVPSVASTGTTFPSGSLEMYFFNIFTL